MNAIYPGSFNPFTYGHDWVVKEIYPLFDHGDNTLFIIPCLNSKKIQTDRKYFDDMSDAIASYYRNMGLSHIRVYPNYGTRLVADMAYEMQAKYIIRGVRDTSDFLQEAQLADANSVINPELTTIYVRAENTISSSLVREMIRYKRNVSDYVPSEVNRVIQKYEMR